MVHKPPEPEGAAQGQGLFIDYKSLSTVVCYIPHSDWSLLLLVNTRGSFHCKQGAYRKHHFYNFLEQNLQLPISIWKIIIYLLIL